MHYILVVDGNDIDVHRFERENRERLENNQRAQFAGNVVSRWLDIRLQMIGVAMVTGVAFIAVLEHQFQTVNPGNVWINVTVSFYHYCF